MGAGALPGGTHGRYDSPLGRHFHSLAEWSAVFPYADILARVDDRTSAGWAFFVIRPRSSPSPSPSRLERSRWRGGRADHSWTLADKVVTGDSCDDTHGADARRARTPQLRYHHHSLVPEGRRAFP